MSLLVTIETGGIFAVTLGGVPVVDRRLGCGSGGFGGGGSGRSGECACRVWCVCPSSVSDEEGLVSDYTLNEESVVGQVDGRVTSYLLAECLIHVLANILHDGYITKVAFGQKGGHSFSILGEGLLAQLPVFGYLFLCLDRGVNYHVRLPQGL